MFTKEYWNKRTLKYGHTGHSEPFLYCFDQEARKFAVGELLKNISFKKTASALDFGCGTGDFLELLNNKFVNVLGYDISDQVLEKAKQAHRQAAGLAFTNSAATLKEKMPYDLILTVTVLQSLDKNELKDTMEQFCSLLSHDGYILNMEFFSTEERNNDFKEDRVTIKEWSEIVENSGLTIVSQHSFYNPILAPAVSWKKYNTGLFLNVLKLFKRWHRVQVYFSKTARQIIYKEKDVLAIENSTFKIYILQKKAHADQTS